MAQTSASSSPLSVSDGRATFQPPFCIPQKQWFSLREVAALGGMSERYVEKKFDQGTELSGHLHGGGSGKRMTKRVPRVWLIAWLGRTAQYDERSLGTAIVAAMRYLPRECLVEINAAATRLLASRDMGGRGA